MKYAVVTFGCRVNQADSLAAEEGLLALGGTATTPEHADVVIVNTCSVTASADQAARQTIRRVSRINPTARVVVTGCYATRRPEDISQLPQVAHVLPNDEKPQLVQVVRGLSPEERATVTTADRSTEGEGACGAAVEPGIAGRTAFTLRVQTGCGERCAYCIIPTTRGRPRSVPIDTLLGEVVRATRAGFKEIALTGVHLGSYGRDLDPAVTLLDLLRAFAEWAARGSDCAAGEHVLFRISSLEPMDCSREIIDLVANAGCFAPHFHLPLQHASDRVLGAMRRPYSIGYYRTLVDHLRSSIPHASIGTDIIVGFPGEDIDDFARLLEYLESCPLTHIHVFPYSDRPGTAASSMDGKIPGATVRERARVVRQLGQRLSLAFRDSQRGTVQRGLTLDDGTLVVTENYLKVRIPEGRTRNQWVRVKVTGSGDPLTGEVL